MLYKAKQKWANSHFQDTQNTFTWGVVAERSSGLAYRTQVLVLAAECGFESRP